MEKPIKPKKPFKTKIVAPSQLLEQVYSLRGVTEDNPVGLQLCRDSDEEDEDARDRMLDRVNLSALYQLVVKQGLDPRYITIESSTDRDGYIDMLYLVYRKPLDAATIEEQKLKHQEAKELADQQYQTALDAYPDALKEYQIKKAEYDVWLANQKLQRAKNG